ncbi:MAG: response regulator [Thermodesulfobacteriota bacterium]|jgi:two-component system alkaline phosphatase synthesis response regulator PhoP
MDRILIIQDSPSVNAMLKFRLESGGFSVETAETGEEGVEKTKACQYQLILLDYNLPGINGSQVCRILKEQDNTQNTPIVFMSAKDEDKLRQITKEAGADGYVGLPFEGKKFIEKIMGFLKARKP